MQQSKDLLGSIMSIARSDARLSERVAQAEARVRQFEVEWATMPASQEMRQRKRASLIERLGHARNLTADRTGQIAVYRAAIMALGGEDPDGPQPGTASHQRKAPPKRD
jgi:hypothetical protein